MWQIITIKIFKPLFHHNIFITISFFSILVVVSVLVKHPLFC